MRSCHQSRIVRGCGYGIIGDIIVGILGGVAGRYLFAALGFASHVASQLLEQGLIALVGAVVFLLIIGLLRPRSIGARVLDSWRRRWWAHHGHLRSIVLWSWYGEKCEGDVFAWGTREPTRMLVNC